MDKSIKCECGSDQFWYFGSFVKCCECYTEMKQTSKETWLRRFNKAENNYTKNWEKIGVDSHVCSKKGLVEKKKCGLDPKYFIENYCKILTSEGLVNIKLRDFQIKLLNLYKSDENLVCLKSRQVGESIISYLFLTWYLLFNEEINVLTLHPNIWCSQDFLSKIRRVYENLPTFLKPKLIINNVKKINLDTGSSIESLNKVYINDNEKKYDFIYISEMAHFHLKTIANMKAILHSDKKIMILSSPNGFNKFYDIYQSAEKGLNNYQPFRIDWWQVPGRDDKWKEAKIRNLGSENIFDLQYENCFNSINPNIKN